MSSDFPSVSKCSTSCGAGRRTRVVTCITHGAPCNITEKPESHETCDLGPCLTKLTAAISSTMLQNSQWLFTDWSDHVRFH